MACGAAVLRSPWRPEREGARVRARDGAVEETTEVENDRLYGGGERRHPPGEVPGEWWENAHDAAAVLVEVAGSQFGFAQQIQDEALGGRSARLHGIKAE